MKLSITVEGLASLSRFDTAPLLDRLRSEVERELLATVAPGEPPDLAAHRDALARAVARIEARRAPS
jgi:hypothetical protein